MSTSIFARNVAAPALYTPHHLISDEIGHLKDRGQSRWRTNPLMATCRTVGGLVFLTLLVLYFLDPFRYAIQKTRAINAYIYLYRFGNPVEVQPLRECGIFSKRDLGPLHERAQLAVSDSVMPYFVSTSEAREAVQETLAFMRELDALSTGDLSEASNLTKIRYFLFRKVGIIPPQQWAVLNPIVDF